MLVQNHRSVIPDFYGVTTSFTRETLKPAATAALPASACGGSSCRAGPRGRATRPLMQTFMDRSASGALRVQLDIDAPAAAIAELERQIKANMARFVAM